MTTDTILYKKEFFYFDPEKIYTLGGKRVANARTNTSLSIKMPEDKNKDDEYNYTLYSNYDLEIFPMNNIADVFCNIKTIMTWKFKIDNQEEFASLPFGESLLH